MKKSLSFKVVVLILCCLLSTSFFTGITASESKSAPKNIIFLIGDGMGPNQVKMAHDYIGKNLNMENMTYKGTSETSNVSGATTDSAAGGTALACGIKTTNGYVGVDKNGNPVQNIREFLAEKGKKTGLVSTVSIADATPAAFGAHNISRTNQSQIAAEYIQRKIDIIMGGGGKYFSQELRNTAKAEGYTVITTKNELNSHSSSTRLLALFHDGNFPEYKNGYPSTTPTIAEMTSKSIDFLKDHEEGFFLMVEGGLIDITGHANNIDNNIAETLQFDQAVKVALDFAKQDGNTLVIVTADHETGGLKQEGNNYRFTSGSHTGVNVPVFAEGKGAENFQGNLSNADFKKKIMDLFVEDESTTSVDTTAPVTTTPITTVANTTANDTTTPVTAADDTTANDTTTPVTADDDTTANDTTVAGISTVETAETTAATTSTDTESSSPIYAAVLAGGVVIIVIGAVIFMLRKKAANE
ncbi:MAG: alkaline phosphatase [Clostridiales bacterium]|nr:alkaline phosphatase [Clostridiales bacterium]